MPSVQQLDNEYYYRILSGKNDVDLNKGDIATLILYMSDVDLVMLRMLRALSEMHTGTDISQTLSELGQAIDAMSDRRTDFMARIAEKVNVDG